jgi:hypothetical protein
MTSAPKFGLIFTLVVVHDAVAVGVAAPLAEGAAVLALLGLGRAKDVEVADRGALLFPIAAQVAGGAGGLARVGAVACHCQI